MDSRLWKGKQGTSGGREKERRKNWREGEEGGIEGRVCKGCLSEINVHLLIHCILQYPAIFCKLVKRSLSCDPIRRPTLPQILSIIKKDSKTVALMTGKRFSGPSSSVAAQQRGGGGGGGRERRLWGSVESLSHCPSTTLAGMYVIPA